MFGVANDAISMVKSHVESFHKHYLPFGITNDEALTLLKEGHEETKPKISANAVSSAQTKPSYSFKNATDTLHSLLDKLLGEDIEVEYRRKDRKKAQLTA
jgi:Ethanolamine utilization protein EutJ (predicted chaperonin)